MNSQVVEPFEITTQSSSQPVGSSSLPELHRFAGLPGFQFITGVRFVSVSRLSEPRQPQPGRAPGTGKKGIRN